VAQLLDTLGLFLPKIYLQVFQSIYRVRRESSSIQTKSRFTFKNRRDGGSGKEGKPLFLCSTQPAIPPADSPSSYQRSGYRPTAKSNRKAPTTISLSGTHQHGIFMAGAYLLHVSLSISEHHGARVAWSTWKLKNQYRP
jgi:hypothetical protein